MTREQACETAYKIIRAAAIYQNTSNDDLRQCAALDVDILATLGLLQLSEPELDKIEKLLRQIGSNRTKESFQATLDYFDLKIVEK